MIKISNELLELKAKYREQYLYAYNLKTKKAREVNFAKAREMQMRIREELDKVMPEYGLANTHGMMLETVGGASGIRGLAPFRYSFGRIEVFSPDFKVWVGNSDLCDNAFGIEPMKSIDDIQERKPHVITTVLGTKSKI